MTQETQISITIPAYSQSSKSFGRRKKHSIQASDLNVIIAQARELLGAGRYFEALDLYEQAQDQFPQVSIEVLNEVYEIYKVLPQDRYSCYQARHFDFGIDAGDKVLDVGSGHLPFPLATHLAEFALSNNDYGRAGQPFKHIDGKPVTECNIEDMPFQDKEFDFAYCSHVLEHVDSPEDACNELMRVANAGYFESPRRGKDLFLNTAGISHHRWALEYSHDRVIFTEYSQDDILGIQNDILMNMHCAPQTPREKAFSALVHLKSDQFNVMVLWKDSFSFEVRRLDGSVYLKQATPRS